MKLNAESRRKVGFACLAGSIVVLLMQQQIGQFIGVGVMALWLGLGIAGVWLLGPGPEDS